MASGKLVKSALIFCSGWLLLFLVFFQGLSFFGFPNLRGYGSFGSRDFIEYWTASALFRQGQNPYHPESMLTLQRALGFSEQAPLMMWNPPWILPLLKLVLNPTDFSKAVSTWLALQLSAYTLAVFVFAAAFNSPRKALPLFLSAAFLSLPAWSSLYFGQLGGFLALALSLYFYGILREKPVCEALGLFFLSLKPHLIFVLVAYRVFSLIKGKQWANLKQQSLTLLLLLTLAVLPILSVYKDWFHALLLPNAPGFIAVDSWYAASLVGLARSMLGPLFRMDSLLPFVAVPLLTLVLTCAYFKAPVKSAQGLCLLLLLSVSVSLQAWFFDFTILLPVFLLGLCQQSVRGLALHLLVVLIYNLITFLVLSHWIREQHWLFWYPLVLLFLFLAYRPRPA